LDSIVVVDATVFVQKTKIKQQQRENIMLLLYKVFIETMDDDVVIIHQNYQNRVVPDGLGFEKNLLSIDEYDECSSP
jgi:hypothetical protein